MSNMSRVWKGEIEEITRRKAAIIAKEEDMKRKKIFDRCVAELTAQGWIFRSVNEWHPHNNDTWIEQEFKSPRMKSFAAYTEKNDLIDLESKIMSAYAMSGEGALKHQLLDQARVILAEFFLTNADAKMTDVPKLMVFSYFD